MTFWVYFFLASVWPFGNGEAPVEGWEGGLDDDARIAVLGRDRVSSPLLQERLVERRRNGV